MVIAQDYPIKPVTVFVPQAAGGKNDIIARILAQRLTDSLEQQFLVDKNSGQNKHTGMSTGQPWNVVDAVLESGALILAFLLTGQAAEAISVCNTQRKSRAQGRRHAGLSTNSVW
jgi:hypothetical protein